MAHVGHNILFYALQKKQREAISRPRGRGDKASEEEEEEFARRRIFRGGGGGEDFLYNRFSISRRCELSTTRRRESGGGGVIQREEELIQH